MVEASGLAAGAIRLAANGDDGSDVLIGSDGDDVLTGGAGEDVILGGLGSDVIDGGDGDDVEIQLVADGDKVTSTTVADRTWVARHLRIDADGKTVVETGGKEHALQQTDLSPLIEDATS